jgi:heme oxygenase|tara:strand:- start:214 stop:759 length:546 start_codon:yes stop_codon:yes gene_type:complete
MSLKELTKDVHGNAERQSFVKVLMSGEIDPELYAMFLANQHPMYDVLEALAGAKGLLNDLPDIRRAPAIHEDYKELWTSDEPAPMLDVTKKYLDHIRGIQDDEVKLFAHVYTRHMGDLSGGKMIALKVPGEGRLYKFKEPDTLKAKIRERLTDDMADESKICFEFATQTFREMLPYVKSSS